MAKFRIIPKLEIKGINVVKGMRMEGLRVVGQPGTMCSNYLRDGADEIIFIDTVASLYNRNQLHELVANTSQMSNVPMTVGGGIRSLNCISELLKNGADKVSINTALHQSPNFVLEASKEFGAQCIVASVQAKKRDRNTWEALYLNGRESSKKEVVDWCKKLSELGVGEFFLTSVDFDGTKQGLDKNLIEAVVNEVPQPVLVSGGTCGLDDIEWAAKVGAAGIVVGNAFHFSSLNIKDVKVSLSEKNISVSIRERENENWNS